MRYCPTWESGVLRKNCGVFEDCKMDDVTNAKERHLIEVKYTGDIWVERDSVAGTLPELLSGRCCK